jgi:hypothetical protein
MFRAPLVTIGAVLLAVAIVARAMESAGVRVPVVGRTRRQIAAGLVGALTMAVGLSLTTRDPERSQGALLERGAGLDPPTALAPYHRRDPAAEAARCRQMSIRQQLPAVVIMFGLLVCLLVGGLFAIRLIRPSMVDSAQAELVLVLGLFGYIGLLFLIGETLERKWRQLRHLGAWGRRAFENVEARRWLRDLETRGFDAVASAFAAVEGDDWGLIEERRALAAAEVTAASAGSVPPRLPRRAITWLASHQTMSTVDLREWVARACSMRDRVEAGSVQRADDPAYDNYFVALKGRLEQAASQPEWRPPGDQRRLDRASAVWAVNAVLAVASTGFLVLVHPNLGPWTAFAPMAAVVCLLIGWVPGTFSLLVAWQFWTARWGRGNFLQRRTKGGITVTRRSLPTLLVVIGLFWLSEFVAVPLRFPASPISSALPDGAGNAIVFASIGFLCAGFVAAIVIDRVHRPAWALPADMRTDPDRQIRVLEAETVDNLTV